MTFERAQNTFVTEERPFTRRPELIGFFREVYGKAFNQEVAPMLLDRADKCLRHVARNQLLIAAAIEGSQVTLLGARIASLNLRHIPQIITDFRSEAGASWASVGEDYSTIQSLCAFAGMQRISDVSIARELLEPFNTGREPTLVTDSCGALVLVNGSDSHAPGYRQQLWAWTES